MSSSPGMGSRRARRNLRAALLCVTALLCAFACPPRAAADSVALTWTAPGDDGNTGTASSYEMRYSVNPVGADTTAWWAAATSVGTMPAPHQAGTRESFIVVGLPAATTFYFAIRTSDEVPNVSGFSNIAVKQTGSSGVPLATPGNFTATVSPGIVLLTWNAVPAGGPELGYHLYRKASSTTTPALLATLPITATAWSDSTASAGQSYDFSLATYDDTAEGTPASLAVTIPGTTLDNATVVHGYPNPARDQVTFRLNVDSTSEQHTRVTVFDLTGHKICLLADQTFSRGQHAISWGCRSDAGYRVAPGIYNVIVDGPSGRAVTRVAIVP